MPHDDIVGDPRVRSMIRRTVRRMLTQEVFAGQEPEDLEQDLFLALLQGLPRFDAKIAHHNVFVRTIINRTVGNMLRRSQAKKRRGVRHDLTEEPLDVRNRSPAQQDLAIDLQQALSRQPEHLANLAELLKSHTLAEAARILGLPRSTLQRWVARLAKACTEAHWKDF